LISKIQISNPKERDAKSSSGKVEIKEIRFSPFIGQGDMDTA
jgi:translation initiation factor IF-3